MDIMVDIGWTPEPSGPLGSVVPLNSLPALMAYLPGNNIIEFGGRNFNTATYGNTMWGGAGQAMIHLEVDGWVRGAAAATTRHVPGRLVPQQLSVGLRRLPAP